VLDRDRVLARVRVPQAGAAAQAGQNALVDARQQALVDRDADEGRRDALGRRAQVVEALAVEAVEVRLVHESALADHEHAVDVAERPVADRVRAAASSGAASSPTESADAVCHPSDRAGGGS
jgi:hypothetical protein